MGEYFIPRKTRVKTVFIKGLTSSDLIWLILGTGATVLLFISGMIPLMILGGIVALLVVVGITKDIAGDRRYESFIWYFRFLAYPKSMLKQMKKVTSR